ncbi:MAG: relaxase domain-containing protein [Planctomycetales bacterium]|nr:relaxase domain-containing protein [Planctomycetales bacterium]
MLSINPMGSYSVSYYSNLARENYYTAGGEPVGRWIGEGAAALGLEGVVDKEEFRLLVKGFDQNKKPLVQNAGDKDRIIGYDLTLSVPKSVSVLWSAADPKTRRQIQDAVHRAARKTIAYLEKTGSFSRAGRDGVRRVPAKLVVASHEHGTSRAQDANLHIHCLVMNVGVDKKGKTRAIDGSEFFKRKMELGAYFRKELSHDLQQDLDVAIRRHEKCFEVVGVNEDLMDAQSTRRHEIDEFMAKNGLSSAKAAEYATLVTRNAKNQPPRKELFEKWQWQADDFGFTTDYINDHVLDQRVPLSQEEEVKLVAERIDEAITELTYQNASFSERQLRQEVLIKTQDLSLPADAVVQHVAETIERSTEIIRLKDFDNERHYTTGEIIRLEQRTFEALSRSLRETAAKVPQQILDDVRDDLLPDKLKPEQDRAFEHVTRGNGRVRMVSGMAGTGKSFLLSASRQAFEREGYKVIGASMAGAVAERMQEDTGIKTRTVKSLLCRLEYEKQNPKVKPILDDKTVLVLDEAAMLGVPSLSTLIMETERTGTTVIATGDSIQTQPLEYGNLFDHMGRNMEVATLKNIKRQREDWQKQAVYQLAKGKAYDALSSYAEAGFVHVTDTKPQAERQLVAEWAKDGLKNPRENLIFAPQNVDVTRINRLCQEEQRRVEFAQGRAPSTPIKVGPEYMFKNDRVVFRKKCKELGVENGNRGHIRAIDYEKRSLHIQLDSGKNIFVSLDLYDKIQLGYCSTVHSGQGATVDKVYILLTDSQLIDLHVGYVMGSRHRLSVHWYVPKQVAGLKLSKVAQRLERDRTKPLAHDLLREDSAHAQTAVAQNLNQSRTR